MNFQIKKSTSMQLIKKGLLQKIISYLDQKSQVALEKMFPFIQGTIPIETKQVPINNQIQQSSEISSVSTEQDIKTFQEYKSTLDKSVVFKKFSNYQKFIELMNNKNKNFFKTFFEAVYNKKDDTNYSNILSAKQRHIEKYDSFQKQLATLNQKPALTSYKIKLDQLVISSTSNKELIKAIEFSNQFVRVVNTIQSIKDYNLKYSQFILKDQRSKNTLLKHEKSENRKLSISVESNKKRCYHDYLSLNHNSIVFSFLLPRDLLVLNRTDRIFQYQIPILLNSVYKNYAKNIPSRMLNHNYNQALVGEIIDLIKEANKLKVSQKEIERTKSDKNLLDQVSNFLKNIHMVLYNKILYNCTKYKVKDLLSPENEYYHFLIQFKGILNLNQGQVDFLSVTLRDNNYEELVKKSVVCGKIYMHLQIITKIYQAGFSDKDEWSSFYSKILPFEQIKQLFHMFKITPELV